MIDQAKLEELKQKHGEVYLLTKDDNQVAARLPTRPEIMRLVDKAGDQRYSDLAAFVRDCIVSPEPSELAALLDRRPGLVVPFSEELCRLAGMSRGVDSKKV